MVLSALSLQFIRSYSKKSFEFSPTTTIVVGPNASGKTNVLEAIYLLATGKSFRVSAESEMISWDKEVGRVGSTIVDEESGEKKLEVVLTRGIVLNEKAPYKKHLVNGVSKRSIDFIGNFFAVLFWPEDLELIIGSPGKRRRYFDSVLTQVDREYRRTLLSFERALRQRNMLLEAIREGRAKQAQLLFWDQLIIKDGRYISEKRRGFVDFINRTVPNSPVLEFPKFEILYDESIISEARLAHYAQAEVASGTTLVGPHRDDFLFHVKMGDTLRSVAHFGSRGEQRLGVLWLKLSELSYLEYATHKKPVLLLDDIFSELDHEHRKIIYHLTGGQQTIMTMADEHFAQDISVNEVNYIRF